MKNSERLSWLMFGVADVMPDEPVELFVEKHLYHLLDQEECLKNGQVLVKYAVGKYNRVKFPDAPERWRCFVQWFFSEAARPEGTRLYAELQSRLKNLEIAGISPHTDHGCQEIEKMVANHGGHCGMLAFCRLHQIISRGLLSFAASEKPFLRNDHGILYSADLTLFLLRSLYPTSAVGSAKVLREWLDFFLSICRKEGNPVPVDPATDSFPELNALLGHALTKGFGGSAWQNTKTAIGAEISDDPILSKTDELWKSLSVSKMDWLCRRAIHPNFNRFYLESQEEAMITLSLTHLMEKGELEWK